MFCMNSKFYTETVSIHPTYNYFITKLSTVSGSVFKNIIIFCPTPNIKVTTTCYDSIDILITNNQVAPKYGSFWSNQYGDIYCGSQVRKIEIAGHSSRKILQWKKHPIIMSTHVFCRCISNILPFRDYNYFFWHYACPLRTNYFPFRQIKGVGMNSFNENESSLTNNHLLFRQFYASLGFVCRIYSGIRTFVSCNSRFLGYFNISTHPSFLTDHPNKLERHNEYKGKININKPPIGRRFAILILSVIGGFYLSIWGDKEWDHHGHRTLGSIAYYLGLLLAASGLFLWFITGFRWSWNLPI